MWRTRGHHRRIAVLGCLSLCLLTAALTAGTHPYSDDYGAVQWRASLTAALQEANVTGKPIFLEASREAYNPCLSFAKGTYPHPEVKKLLRRYFICVVLDRERLPTNYDRYLKGKAINEVPVSLFLTKQGDIVSAHPDDIRPPAFLGILKGIMSDQRFALSKSKEAELQTQVQALEDAVVAKDEKAIHSAWQAIHKLPGLHPLKTKAIDLLEREEEASRNKMDDAEKLIRQEKYPLARVALEEAVKFSEHLPVKQEVQQALASLPHFESAAEWEKSKKSKWKQNALSEYQKIVQKYTNSPLANLAQVRIRALVKMK